MKAPDWKTPEAAARRLGARALSTVEQKPINWVWYPYIPRGTITTLEGEGKMGKSFIAYSIAAAISSGQRLPGQLEASPPHPVLVLSAEDDMEHVIGPRMSHMHADMTNVYVVDRPLVLDASGMKSLELEVKALGAHVVIIDPILAYTGSKVDINKGNDVRVSLMGPLNAIANKYDIAIILVRHFGKAKKDEKYQGLGSVDLTNAARSQLQVRRWQDGSTALVHTASNYAQEGPPILYSIEPGPNNIGILRWGGITEYPVSNRPLKQRDDMKQWLRDILAAGPVPSAVVQSRAEEAGLSWDVLKKAKAGLVKSEKVGDHWEWRLSD